MDRKTVNMMVILFINQNAARDFILILEGAALICLFQKTESQSLLWSLNFNGKGWIIQMRDLVWAMVQE